MNPEEPASSRGSLIGKSDPLPFPSVIVKAFTKGLDVAEPCHGAVLLGYEPVPHADVSASSFPSTVA